MLSPSSTRNGAFFLSAVALALVALASVGGCNSTCRDFDRDGFGDHCALGRDCDDQNAARNVDCVNVPPPDCEADPSATGCPCFLFQTTACYDGPAGTADVGLCVAGAKSCVNGIYGVCQQQRIPTDEVCDGLDQDCDGRVDDGVLSPCGGCDPACLGAVWGQGDLPFVGGGGLEVLDSGSLELARSEPPSPGLFVGNTAEDSVSRIDVAALAEIARYAVGDEPSRIALDLAGDVFVANQASTGFGTLSKIATDLGRCVDRDGTPGIRTSTGPTDVLPLGQDECVLYTTTISEWAEGPRALVVDGNPGASGLGHGDAWVGLHEAEAIVRVDGATGTALERVETPGFRPYAAAMDAQGYVWMASQDGYLLRVDRSTHPPTTKLFPVPVPCYLVYGLAISREGEIFLSGYSCDQVLRYDPTTSRVVALGTVPNPRGGAFLGSDVYAAHTDGRVSHIGASPFTVRRVIDLQVLGRTPIDTIVTAVDGTSAVWAVSRLGGPVGVGLATRIDPATDTVTAHVAVGQGPRAEGDLTGRARMGSFPPSGSIRERFAGCGGALTHWKALHFRGDPGPLGSLRFEVRWASDESGLDAATYVVVGTIPAGGEVLPLSLPDGGAIELRLTLATASPEATPRVDTVGVEWACGGPNIE